MHLWANLVLSNPPSYTRFASRILYGHPLNTDTSLLRTVCFKRKPLHFLYIQPALSGHAANTDTFYDPLSVRINGV